MQFNEEEKRCIRIIAKWFRDNKRNIDRSEAMKEFGIYEDRYEALMRMLEHKGVIEEVTSTLDGGYAINFHPSAYSEELAREFNESDKNLDEDRVYGEGNYGEGVYGGKQNDTEINLKEESNDLRRLSDAFIKFLMEKKGYSKTSLYLQERDQNYDNRNLNKGIRQYLSIFDHEFQRVLAIVEFGLVEDDRTIKVAWEHVKEIKSTINPKYFESYVVFPEQEDFNEDFTIIQFHQQTEEMQWIFCKDFPDYETLRNKENENNGKNSSNEEEIKTDEDLKIAFEKYLVEEKGYKSENYSTEQYGNEYPVTRIIDEENNKILALMAFSINYFKKEVAYKGIEEFKEKRKIRNLPCFVIFAIEDKELPFYIWEYDDNEEPTEILNEDFPAFKQLLFTSPLSNKGRRIYKALMNIVKNDHDVAIYISCEDYINLQIKKNNRMAAQIHRINNSDENIALVLAGYQENFPDVNLTNYMFKGEVIQLSGYSNKYPAEISWLEGKLRPQLFKYKAGVYILRPGSLALDEVVNEVNGLLELAKNNALNKGPAEAEESTLNIGKSFGNIPTIRVENIGEIDRLGRDKLVKTLAGLFVQTECSNGFTMALLGDWGQGKSTVMGLLQEELREKHKEKFEFATYNAWEYEKTGNVTAGLAQEVVKGLVSSKKSNFFERQKLTFLFVWKAYKGELKRLGKCLLVILSIILFALLFSNNTLLKDLGLAGVVGVLICGFKNLNTLLEHPLASKLETYLKLPAYGKHLGDIPIIQSHMKTLCGILLKNNKKLVVFVDDLDRCDIDHIVGVLDGIRLVMTIPNVIVIIGIDHRIAFNAISKHYQELADKNNDRGSAEIARDYLGKIIQLPLRLNASSHEELREYIFEDLFNKNNLVDDSKNIMESDGKDFHQQPKASYKNKMKPEKPNKVKQDVTKEKIDEAIKDTISERSEFYRLVGKFNFSNPRQLLRLHNSFRFLKGFNLVTGKRFGSLDILTMLFWQEFLHNWPMETRVSCMAALYSDSKLEQAKPEVRNVFNNVKDDINKLFSKSDNCKALAEFVRIVVLPHNEEGVFDTKEEIEEWTHHKTNQKE